MQRLLVLFLVAGLAGCLAPNVPDDAAVDEDEGLPGLKLSAWTEDSSGRTRMHGLLVNEGTQTYDIRIGCGHPWTSTITAPDGSDVHFREVLEEPGCAPFWDVLAPGGDMEVQYSWDGRDHDVENDIHTKMPDGVYTWTLQFHLRDRAEFLEATRPIVIGEPPEPMPGFSMTLDADGHNVTATVRNDGDTEPEFWTGCLMEWGWRILDADGDAVPREPWGTCAGFQETTFPPGHEVNATFTWNAMVWDADSETTSPAPHGTYTWEVTFGLQGKGGDVLVETADFQV